MSIQSRPSIAVFINHEKIAIAIILHRINSTRLKIISTFYANKAHFWAIHLYRNFNSLRISSVISQIHADLEIKLIFRGATGFTNCNSWSILRYAVQKNIIVHSTLNRLVISNKPCVLNYNHLIFSFSFICYIIPQLVRFVKQFLEYILIYQ